VPLALLGVFVVAAVVAGGVVGYVYGFARGQAVAGAAAATTPAATPATIPGDTEIAVAPAGEAVTPSADPDPAGAGDIGPPAAAEPAAAPPAKAAADPAPPARSGSLFVDSRPRGAAVIVDGRRRGRTPLRLADLSAGTYAVRLDLSGYRPVATSVDVRAGEQARVAVTLEFRADAPAASTPGGWHP
jgi:hypothetical protein